MEFLSQMDIISELNDSTELELKARFEKMNIDGKTLKDTPRKIMHLILEKTELILQFEIFINRICAKFNFQYQNIVKPDSSIHNLSNPTNKCAQPAQGFSINNILAETSWFFNQEEERTYTNLDENIRNQQQQNIISLSNNPNDLNESSTIYYSNGKRKADKNVNSAVKEKKRKLPDLFSFPVENLDEVIRAKLEQPDVALTKSDRLKVVNAIFKRLEVLEIIYMSSNEYEQAINSFGVTFPFVFNDKNPNIKDELRRQLKNKMQASRRKDTDKIEILDARKKYAPSTRKQRSKKNDSDSQPESNSTSRITITKL